MTILQKLQVRQSEIRESINKLLGNDSRSETEQGELEKLTAEAQKLEPEIRAAILVEPDPETTITKTSDPEQRERIELRSKTGLADFLSAAAGGREVSGAAREYAASVGCSPRGANSPWISSKTVNRRLALSRRDRLLTDQLSQPFHTCSRNPPPQVSVSKCRRMGPVRSKCQGSQPRRRPTRRERKGPHQRQRQ